MLLSRQESKLAQTEFLAADCHLGTSVNEWLSSLLAWVAKVTRDARLAGILFPRNHSRPVVMLLGQEKPILGLTPLWEAAGPGCKGQLRGWDYLVPTDVLHQVVTHGVTGQNRVQDFHGCIHGVIICCQGDEAQEDGRSSNVVQAAGGRAGVEHPHP